ncbi:hypothetical protein PS1_035828 [Malus domestica]
MSPTPVAHPHSTQTPPAIHGAHTRSKWTSKAATRPCLQTPSFPLLRLLPLIKMAESPTNKRKTCKCTRSGCRSGVSLSLSSVSALGSQNVVGDREVEKNRDCWWVTRPQAHHDALGKHLEKSTPSTSKAFQDSAALSLIPASYFLSF